LRFVILYLFFLESV